MTDLPAISIVLVTYMRTEEALATIRSAVENLGYPKELRAWFVADDGSPKQHMDALLGVLQEKEERIIGSFSDKLVPNTCFCGKVWNIGLKSGHDHSDIVLWLEDDWVLNKEWDMRPYVRLLLEKPEVGMVSMRTLATDGVCGIAAHDGLHYLNYLYNSPFAYSGNPSFRHRRFLEDYGVFRTDKSPGDIEVEMNRMFYYRHTSRTSQIWRPVDIGGWGIWGHIGTYKTWE